jgi:hypothetical protein
MIVCLEWCAQVLHDEVQLTLFTLAEFIIEQNAIYTTIISCFIMTYCDYHILMCVNLKPVGECSHVKALQRLEEITTII